MSVANIGALEDAGRREAGIVASLLFLLVAPFVLSSFLTGLVLDGLILALFVLGFNQVFGYTGLLSFGHAAYYGTGAYVVAIVLSNEAVPGALQSMIPAVVIGVIAAMVVAAVFGAFCVQRGEIYFAMLTLAFSMMLYRGVIQFDQITGGVNGLIISSAEIDLVVASFSALETLPYYYFTLVIAVVATAGLWRLVNSPYGEVLKTIRENPERAAFIGVPVKHFQWTSFVISGGVAGLAGSLAAIRIFVVTPGSVHWLKSAEPVIITLLGGPGSFIGPIVGTLVFLGLEEILTNLTTHWQFGLGLVLVPIVLYAQNGIVGLASGFDPLSRFRGEELSADEPPSDAGAGKAGDKQ